MRRFIVFIVLALTVGCGLGGQAHAAVNDFTVQSFDAQYYLGKTSDGHSTLRTVETITVAFPETNQNHGIERALPSKYDGHKTSLRIESVRQLGGTNWNYTTYSSGDATVLRIGDANTYVHGQQTYVITYTQQDVTRYFANTNDDELYWDTNGTGWQQPFSSLTASIIVDKSLVSSLNNKQSCYEGLIGSNETCAITRSDTPSGNVEFTVTANRMLNPGENVTFAIGFAPHTFAKHTPTFSEKYWPIMLGIIIGSNLLGFVAIMLLQFRYQKMQYRRREVRPIVTEYIPPKGVSVLAAAKTVERVQGKAQTAQLIDLAVRHYLKLYQVSEKSLWKQAEYELEIVGSMDDVTPEEQSYIQTLFGGKTRLAMKTLKNNSKMYAALSSNDRQLTKALATQQYGLYEKGGNGARWFRRTALVLFILSILTLSIMGVFAAILAFVLSFTFKRLTDKGLALERYLLGLKEYIKLAEADRLTLLQSPEGAQKVGETVSATNPQQLIKLYERVLPYAVLFGLEKGWNEQLGRYYTEANVQPNWYHGTTAFNAAVFATAMNSFSATAISYSSSSGGSSGGGSSGGGGGGGGGGGW